MFIQVPVGGAIAMV